MMKTDNDEIVEEPSRLEEHPSVAEAAENLSNSGVDSSSSAGGSQSNGSGVSGYTADRSASDAEDNGGMVGEGRVSTAGGYKLSVECFRQHQHPHHHHYDDVASRSISTPESPNITMHSHHHNHHRHHHHSSRRKRRLTKKQPSSSAAIPHQSASSTNAAAAAAAAAAPQHWDIACLAADTSLLNIMDQRQAIEIFLANGATSIDSHIQLMGLVSAYFDSNGCMPPAFPLQQQQEQPEATGATAPSAEPFMQQQQESSEGFTAFFTTTHSSAAQSESTGTGTSAATASSKRTRDQKKRGHESDGEETAATKSTKRRASAAAPGSSSSLSSSELSQTSKTLKTTHRGSGGGGGGAGSSNSSPGANHNVTSGTLFNKNITLLPGVDTDGPDKKRKAITEARSSNVQAQEERSNPLGRDDDRKMCKTTGPRQERQQEETSSSPKSLSVDTTPPIVPGQPVTLDQVLRFSNTPRLIVKSVPPFRVVHANAAYYRLTSAGNDNVVGAAISSLLSLPNNGSSRTLQDDASNHDTLLGGGGSKHPGLLQVQQGGDPRVVCLERLVVAGGFGRCHLIQVTSPPKKNCETNDVVDDKLSITPASLFSATIAPVASDIHVMEQRKQQQQYNESSSLIACSNNNNMSCGMQHYPPPATHYVIQLEPVVEQQVDFVLASVSSSSNSGLLASCTSTGTSVEEGRAQPPLGLSKEEVDRLLQPPVRLPTHGNHDDGTNSAFPHHMVQA